VERRQKKDIIVIKNALSTCSAEWWHIPEDISHRAIKLADVEMSCDEKVLSMTGQCSVKGWVENVWHFKNFKRWAAIIAVMLYLIVTAACAANQKENSGVQETSGLYGNYLFETAIYMNPLSSFYPFDGYVEYYTFTEDMLMITNETGLQTIVPAKYEKVAVDTEAFKDAFDIDVGVPDISKYKERFQYTLNELTSTNPAYRLYLMGSEVWLARINNTSIWSIYKLKRVDGDFEDQASASIQADVDKADDVSRNKGNVIVVSGNNNVSALVYDSPSEIPLQYVKDKIEYLKIDLENDNDKIEPFSVYADSVEQFGSYGIYDAETFEANDFFRPSGLPPQTLLQNAESGHSYIVELSVGEWDENGEIVVGKKFIFGVTIPI